MPWAPAGVSAFNADVASTKLMGDSIYTNPMMLGYAWQKGWIPLGRESLMRAIELNGVAVDNNKAAFEWGRRAAHDWASVEKLLAPAQVIEFKKRETLDSIVARRVEFLTAYQNAAYADSYKQFVEKVRQAEDAAGQDRADRVGGTLPVQADGLQGRVRGRPPARRDRLPGEDRRHVRRRLQGQLTTWRRPSSPSATTRANCRSSKFGPAMLMGFRVLAKLKGLRGTPLDIFGRTEERRTERALIGEYRASVEQVLAGR